MTISDLKLLIKDLPDDMRIMTIYLGEYEFGYGEVVNIGRDRLDKDEVLLIS